MDAKEFEYLIKIADLGSISKAANQLYLTPSALSKFMQKLETEMGMQLFVKTRKGLTLTFAGERCVEVARRVLALNGQLRSEIDQIANNKKGQIRWGFHGSWAIFFYKLIAPEFRKRYPDVLFRLYEFNAYAKLMQAMDNGEIDFAFIGTAWEEHPQYTCERLREQSVVLVAHIDDPVVKKASHNPLYLYPFVDFESLRDASFVMRQADTNIRAYAFAALRKHNIIPNIVLETASMSSALTAVDSGMGLTFAVDDPLMLKFSSNICYLACEGMGTSKDKSYLNIVYDRKKILSGAEKNLIEMVKKYY